MNANVKTMYRGESGESEFGRILSKNRMQSNSTSESSLGFFHDVFYRDGQYFSAVVPFPLNGGGENFEAYIEPISTDKAKKLIYG